MSRWKPDYKGDRKKGRQQVATALHLGPRVVPDIIGGEPFSILAWEEWMQRAACLDVDPEIFYPDPGCNDVNRAARQICKGCPVRAACLAHAVKTNEPYGIWGGLGYPERRRFKAGAA